jgi:hypothetical protein
LWRNDTPIVSKRLVTNFERAVAVRNACSNSSRSPALPLRTGLLGVEPSCMDIDVIAFLSFEAPGLTAGGFVFHGLIVTQSPARYALDTDFGFGTRTQKAPQNSGAFRLGLAH